MKEEDESTIMSVVRLNAFNTSFVDSLLAVGVRVDVSFSAINSANLKRKQSAMGNRMPLKCARHFSTLLFLALRVLMRNLYIIFEDNENFKQEAKASLMVKEIYSNDVVDRQFFLISV